MTTPNKYRDNCDGTTTIFLNKGESIISTQDKEIVSPYRWVRVRGRYTFYVQTTYRKANSTATTTLKLHRLVTHADGKFDVDHKDFNGLNNTRTNLRVCTESQNMQNSRKRRGTISKYKGVSFHRESNKWVAGSRNNGIYKYLGIYGNEILAAIAYNIYALATFGDFAHLNEIPYAQFQDF